MNEEGLPGYRNPDNFIVVSDPYPTVDSPGCRPDSANGYVGGKKKAHMVMPNVVPNSGISRLSHRVIPVLTSGS